MHNALDMPTPGRWIAAWLLSVLVVVILYVIIRAIIFILQFPSSSQIDLEQLISLSNFSGLRAYRIAVEQFLKPYLEDFTNLSPKNREKFLQLLDVDEIMVSAKSLLDPERGILKVVQCVYFK